MSNATRRRKTTEERRAQVASLRDRLAEFEAMTDAGLIASTSPGSTAIPTGTRS